MNEEERYDEKKLLQELSTDKARRSNILISLNCSLQRTERIVANVKDMRELQEYKIAVVSVESELKKTQQENQQLKETLEASEKARKEAIEYIKTNPLYEEEYDYNYDDELELFGINSEQAKYDLLDILDIDKGEMKDE